MTEGEVIACVDCGGTHLSLIDAGSMSGRNDRTEGTYYCQDCGTGVEAERRPVADGAHNRSVSGMAKLLDEMDPDDIDPLLEGDR